MENVNKCGDCTLCCELFPVKWLNKPSNTVCKYCNKGCMIQDTKPAECSDYNCTYAQMENVPIELRPDKCGIIFDKLSDNIIYGLIDIRIEVTEIAKKQITAFINQGYSVVLAKNNYKGNKFFINKNHDETDIKIEFKNHITEKLNLTIT